MDDEHATSEEATTNSDVFLAKSGSEIQDAKWKSRHIMEVDNMVA